nr:stage II sporulation protein M [uncultured Mediterraneibacter sp.]
MKVFHTRKKQFLAFFMPGFFLGIIYVNFIAKKYMAEPGIFSDYFLTQFTSVQIDVREYLLYLLRLRLLPLSVLAALSFTKARRAAAVLFLVWTGFSGGVLISCAAAGLGIKGSLLCVTALLPQFLLYIPAYLILLWYCYSAPGVQWNRQKTIFVILAMSVGIILELYVNPVLVKAFLSVL